MVFDHRNNPHTSIVMPKDRAEAIARVATLLGVSSHVVIQRSISLYLSVFDEDA